MCELKEFVDKAIDKFAREQRRIAKSRTVQKIPPQFDDLPDTMLDDDYDHYPNDESNLRGGHLPEDRYDR